MDKEIKVGALVSTRCCAKLGFVNDCHIEGGASSLSSMAESVGGGEGVPIFLICFADGSKGQYIEESLKLEQSDTHCRKCGHYHAKLLPCLWRKQERPTFVGYHEERDILFDSWNSQLAQLVFPKDGGDQAGFGRLQ